MRALKRTTIHEFGSFPCDVSRTDLTRHCVDSATRGEYSGHNDALHGLAQATDTLSRPETMPRSASMPRLRGLLRTPVLPQGGSTLSRASLQLTPWPRLPPAVTRDGGAAQPTTPSRMAPQAPPAPETPSPAERTPTPMVPPTAPHLAGIPVDDHATAALARQHAPLLRAWWQAAYGAMYTGALKPHEIEAQDFSAMQRVMGLAMLEGMHRRWMSGCGPSGKLALPNLHLLPDTSLQALRAIHAFVVTRPAAQREQIIARLVEAARLVITAGEAPVTKPSQRECLAYLRRSLLGPVKGEVPIDAMAVTLFQAATAAACTARGTQAILLSVFWKMLENHSRSA